MQVSMPYTPFRFTESLSAWMYINLVVLSVSNEHLKSYMSLI